MRFLAGGGEMGERIRAFDWAKTALGPVDGWPQSLLSAVSMLLPSKAQIVCFWGPDLNTLYNDAYRPVFGAKHPHALGLPAREAWSEIWEGGLEDLFLGVLRSGEAYWAASRPFYLKRNDFLEETFFDVSYDPVRGESGEVAGLYCIVTETTAQVLGERRLQTLRDLSAVTAGARSIEEVMRASAAILEGDAHLDVPFALFYRLEDDGRRAVLAATSGIAPGITASPFTIELGDSRAVWPLDAVARDDHTVEVAGLAERFDALPGGAWPESPQRALVLPLRKSGQAQLAGFVVAAVSPRLPFDEEYAGFLELLAGHVATAVANARAYEEEAKRAAALAALDRAKTEFFSNVSHEFRTPLTLMLGPVEEILGRRPSDLAPETERQLELVHRNGQRLLRLVNTLLDFSRIEAGRARARFQPTELGRDTAEIASVFRSAMDRAGLRFTVDCESLDEPAYVDREMWEKIVLNLLSNAFKFTFEGEIAVVLRRVGRRVRLEVRDTGTGIAAEEMPRLFERFHRVRNARGRSHEGSGIGLALVQELVKQHGGKINATSQPGVGTTFMILLPLGSAHLPPDQVDETPAPAAANPSALPFVEEALRWLPGGERDDDTTADRGVAAGTSGGKRPRVLVADDNADMRQYLERILGERYVVETAGDGEQALAAAHEHVPDLVVADVMMPRLDGFGLLRALRGDPATRDVAVILLSARAGEESRVEGLEAGADDYMVKPFHARELLARVSGNLRLVRMRRETADALREADRRKDEFLATLAHELRGPLAPLRNSLEVLRLAGGDPAFLDQAHATMERQLGHLVRLVDDLLDVNRITRNKLELRMEPVDLQSIVREAVENCRALVAGAGHALVVDVPLEPIRLVADRVRLVQVFQNLVGNACKYTEPGGRIEVLVERAGDEVFASVKDDGIGIPADQLPRVFDMFMQVDQAVERAQGGLGIGLTLVQRLVEMHGGNVEAHSDGPGRGSTFVVRLPVSSSAVKTEANAGGGAAPTNGEAGLLLSPPQRSVSLRDTAP